MDPITGVHTNDIESLWSACKAKFKQMRGVKREFVPDYIDEFLWRRKREEGRVFADVLSAIRKYYPVP